MIEVSILSPLKAGCFKLNMPLRRLRYYCADFNASNCVFVYEVCVFLWSVCIFSISFCAFFKLGSTAIGVKTKEGVVLAVEKRITSPLLVCISSFFLGLFCS